MNILRVKDTTVFGYDLCQFLLNKNIDEGDRFGISWKLGKRRKLRSYHLDHFRFWQCESCGNIVEINLKKGDKIFHMDNHLGLYSFSLSSLP